MINKSSYGYLTCIKAFDGIPLFSRTCPNAKPLPLSLVSTLNSIYTYGDNYEVKLHSADSNNFKIVWKIFHSSLTMILVEPIAPVDEHFYFDKIDMLFNALVFMYGLDDLINIGNVEKFKKEIKISYNLLDAILDNSFKFDLVGGFVTNSIDTLVISEQGPLQSVLDESCLSVQTSLACLAINGRMVVASTAWWELNPTEIYLISLLGLTLNDTTCRDIPIYLPCKSPNSALRLLTYNMTSSVTCHFICEEKPSIDAVEPIIKKLWHPIYKSLVNLKQYVPRNLPPSLTLDVNMIGFILIDKVTRCCFSSVSPITNKKPCTVEELHLRYQTLKYCYLNISTNYFQKYFSGTSTIADEYENENSQLSYSPEAYTLINEIRCFALNEPKYQFYAIYNQSIPVYALRGVTKTCFNILTNS